MVSSLRAEPVAWKFFRDEREIFITSKQLTTEQIMVAVLSSLTLMS